MSQSRDVITTGLKQLWTGHEAIKITEQVICCGLQAAAISEGKVHINAGLADGAISIGLSAVAVMAEDANYVKPLMNDAVGPANSSLNTKDNLEMPLRGN